MSNFQLSAVLLLITTALLSTTCQAVEKVEVGKLQNDQQRQHQNQTNVKLQARILLETNNLDIDEKYSTPIPSTDSNALLTTETQQISSATIASPTTSAKGKRKRKLKSARSDGSLSNIWSMFLPGSSAAVAAPTANNDANDYEESLESEESGGDVSHQNQSGENITLAQVAQPEIGSVEQSKQKAQEQVTVMEKNDERLVAKYSRPPRQDGMSSADVISTTMPSTMKSPLSQEIQFARNASNSASVKPNVDAMIENSTVASKSDLQPVQLITGALSRDIGTISPNMNDIVSNILGSMSWQNTNNPDSLQSNRSSSSLSSSVDSGTSSLLNEVGEREDDDKQVTTARTQTTVNNKNSNFERWLNRIQFQEPPVGMTTTTTTSTQTSFNTEQQLSTTTRPLLNRSTQQPLRTPEINTTSAESRSTSPFTSIRWPPVKQVAVQATVQPTFDQQSESFNTNERASLLRKQVNLLQQQFQQQQQQQQQQLHQPISRSTKIQFPEGVKGALQSSTQRVMSAPILQHQNNKFQHPFQQHLRQHQAQLIHGIKQPAAQASTISVSTQDGTSNTSLSFAPHLSSLMNSLNNEMSQVVNSTPSSNRAIGSGSSNDEQSSVDSNMFQSQDEILRQVTSAINFEQQFNHKRSDVHNHRKPGETSAAQAAPLSFNDIDSPDSISKMFKVGSSLSELTESQQLPTTTTSAPGTSSSTSSSGAVTTDYLKDRLRLQSNSSANQSMLGSEDIDKNFDMLAERLKALAQQHQQLMSNGSINSAQPSWLRRPDLSSASDLVSASNLTRLAASLAGTASNTSGTATANSPNQPISLEQIRELLNKHERSKNELKSSQEAVGLLMQQLMQMNQSHNGIEDVNIINGLDKQSSHQIQQRQNSQSQMAVAGLLQQVPQSNVAGIAAAQQQDNKPPAAAPVSGVSNIGWTPVLPSGVAPSPPPSPANQIKNRLINQRPAQIAHHQMKISQADNVGIGQDLANDDFYMKNLAFMFASSQQANPEEEIQPNQRIIGLPIAILKEEDDLSDSMPQSQLEAMAEQLSAGGVQSNRHLLQANQQQQHPQQQQQQQFSSRLAAQTTPPQQHHFEQQPPQNHLSQVQQIVQGYSPQTFGSNVRAAAFHQHVTPTNMLAKSSPAEVVAHHQMNAFQQQQHPEFAGNLVSLMQENNQQEQNPFLPTFASNIDANDKLIEPQTNLIADQSPRDLAENPVQQPVAQQQAMQPQQQQQPQQQSPPHLTRSNPESQSNQYKTQDLRENVENPLMMQHQPAHHHPNSHHHQYLQQGHSNIENMRPQMNDEFRLQRQSQHQQPQQVAPPPMHPNHPNSQYMQSVINNYPRPPGLGMGEITPHPHMRMQPPMVTTTITNNGPPVRLREVSLYKPFGFRTHHSVAYQASPAMAAMFPGLSQPSRPSLLRHMTPFRAAYNEGQRLLSPLIPHQIADNLRQHSYQSGAQSLLNALPISSSQMRQAPHNGYNQLKRHSHLANRDNRRSKIPMSYPSASRLEVQHLEPDEIDRENLMEDTNFDHNNFEEIKFIPMDSSSAPTIEEEGLHLLRKPSPAALDKKPGRSSGQLVKFRQQRARQFDVVRQSKNLAADVIPTIRHCIQPPVKFSANSTTTTTVSPPVSEASSEVSGKSSGTTARLAESTTLASPAANTTLKIDDVVANTTNATTITTTSTTATTLVR